MDGIVTDIDVNGRFAASCGSPDDVLGANQLASVPLAEWTAVMEQGCAPANPDEFEANMRNMIGETTGKIENQTLKNHAYNLVSEANQAARADGRAAEGAEPAEVGVPRRFEGNGMLMDFYARYGEEFKQAIVDGADPSELRDLAEQRLTEMQEDYSAGIDAVMDEVRNPTPEAAPEVAPEVGPERVQPIVQEI
ncbi:MAG TPA: hypothetical protein EYG18_02255 [Micavibrio sp.]|nr:hypothetical protein [Micavibrio sp.]HIL28070.1 hypothetical protein [Micavibrio sp.]